jgi:glycosyltransferase involved in cell wall biosynthesis
MKVLSIGPDKDLLTPGSVSFGRHVRYAQQLEELHAVVFAREKYGKARVNIAPNAWSYPTGSKSVLGLFLDAYRIGRTILREPGQWVISAQDPFESGLVAYVLSRATGVPLLIQEHGDFFSTNHWRRESLANRVRYWVGRFLIHRATHLRVVDERIKRTLMRLGIPEGRISVAPVFTDVTLFENARPDPAIQALRPPGGVLILTMARFVPQKDLSLMIRAFGLLVKQGIAARLVIIGRGPEVHTLKRLASHVAPESITFLEWTDDPASAIKAVDIYALSSVYEGWGRVCIETLAAGVPLIMTDVGCANSVVRNGENGIVVPIGDVARFAAGLHILVSDATLRARLSQAGLATLRTLPTIKESIASYIHTLTSCLPNNTLRSRTDAAQK